MVIRVLKRDGSTEPFLVSKIVRVVKAAGLEPQQAVGLGAHLNQWAENLGRSQITSLAIRDQVLRELERVNPHVANLFRWYEKTKDHDGRK